MGLTPTQADSPWARNAQIADKPDSAVRGRSSWWPPDHLARETDYYQQYQLKDPFGYRCHSATGIKVPR